MQVSGWCQKLWMILAMHVHTAFFWGLFFTCQLELSCNLFLDYCSTPDSHVAQLFLFRSHSFPINKRHWKLEIGWRLTLSLHAGAYDEVGFWGSLPVLDGAYGACSCLYPLICTEPAWKFREERSKIGCFLSLSCYGWSWASMT
jgi:hypothetical protein